MLPSKFTLRSENLKCEFCGSEYTSERHRDIHMDFCSFMPLTPTSPLPGLQRLRPDRGSFAIALRERRSLLLEIPNEDISFQGKLYNPMETTIIWTEEFPIFREVAYVDSIQGPAKLTWKEERKLYQGKAPLSLGEHTGNIVLSTTGITMGSVQPFEVKKEGTGMSIVMLQLACSKTKSTEMDKYPTEQTATNTAALEAETGTELCRVKLEGGSLGGYRSDILTENLSEREVAVYKCTRCKGIMKDASIGDGGDQLCLYCRKDEQIMPNANVCSTILSLKCVCPLSKRGCEWLGRLENVENHLATCGHVYESCQLLCGVVTTRDLMGRHVREECSHREEACLHCSGMQKLCEMVEHVKVCGKVEVLCELGCGTRVRRESILCHRESECSEELVVCPYEKYRCEVVGLKRRELKKHLEVNRLLHTELKLIASDEKFENSMKKIEFLEKKVKSLENNLKIKDGEIELLKGDVQVRHESIVKWTVNKFVKKFKPKFGITFSDFYAVAGYGFMFFLSSDDNNFKIKFNARNGDNYSLKWPFKAIFITRVVSHRNIKNSLIFKSPPIVLSRVEYNYTSSKIASIPLSTDLKEFIKSDSLELEVTVRILQNI